MCPTSIVRKCWANAFPERGSFAATVFNCDVAEMNGEQVQATLRSAGHLPPTAHAVRGLLFAWCATPPCLCPRTRQGRVVQLWRYAFDGNDAEFGVFVANLPGFLVGV
jgi:hypothetical protein